MYHPRVLFPENDDDLGDRDYEFPNFEETMPPPTVESPLHPSVINIDVYESVGCVVSVDSSSIAEKDNCSICLETLTTHASRIVNCGHLFHRECINEWVMVGKGERCPNCRGGIISN